MRKQQSGFTLVEIAIVLVIIGLLLGGILKGQELINSAKVKNLANDFRIIPTYMYGYQDKFKAIPGDDALVTSMHLANTSPVGTLASTPAGKQGNGVIDGNWNSTTQTDESFLFWQHVRLANLAAGPTTATAADYVPKNALGGDLGISSASTAQLQITGMSGSYQICSKGIPGKFVKQLDTQMDDGNTASGSIRAVPDGTALATAAGTATASIGDADPYTVCMVF
jgi:prepilin-type N-terminal cleavage/methylation domain-containing protein